MIGTALAISSAIASIGGGIVGQLASAGEKQKAAQALQEAQDQIKSLNLPLSQARPLIIQKLQSAGVWKPEMEQHINAGISQASQVQEDPSLRAKQQATLDALQGISQTGLTATGRADFNKYRAQAQQDTEAKRQQIMQAMQSRGLAGGGAELASALAANQGGAATEAQAADNIGAQQEAARMSALGQMGSLSGQVRAQDFSNNMAKAQSADAFHMFDIQNQLAQQQRNVASKNQAAQYDVMNNQSLMNQNTANANAELYRQRQGEQTDYANQAGLAQLKAQAANAAAGQYAQQAQNTQQGWANIGQGAAAGMGAYGNYLNGQQSIQNQKDIAGATIAQKAGASYSDLQSQYPSLFAAAPKPASTSEPITANTPIDKVTGLPIGSGM